MFSADSTYIPKNALACDGLWHSHHGYFAEVAQDAGYKLLENVNVNVNEDPVSLMRSVAIVTSHKATFDAPVWKSEQALELMASVMAELHDRNKQILRDMLASAVQKKIKLFAEQEAN